MQNIVLQEKLTMLDLVKNKTVAVVGNASSLFEKNYGELIDNHNVVIRFNKPAIFYEENVEKSHGKKITAWAFFSNEAFVSNVLDEEENIDIVKYNFYENKDVLKLYVKDSNSNEEDSLTYPKSYNTILRIDVGNIISKYRLSKINSTLRAKKKLQYREYGFDCTTGLKILHWLFMSSPSKVSIFGFDFKKTPTFSEKERFEEEIKDRIDIRCRHNFEAEELYVKNVLLRRRKNFRLYE